MATRMQFAAIHGKNDSTMESTTDFRLAVTNAYVGCYVKAPLASEANVINVRRLTQSAQEPWRESCERLLKYLVAS